MSDRNYSAEYVGYTLFWSIRLRPSPFMYRYCKTFLNTCHHKFLTVYFTWIFHKLHRSPLILLSELQYDDHRSRRCLKVVEGVILAQTVVTTTRWLLMVSNSQIIYRYPSRWCVLRCSAMPRYARNCSMAGSSLSVR